MRHGFARTIGSTGDARPHSHMTPTRTLPVRYRVLAGVVALLLSAPVLAAQTPLPVYREPRHRLVLEVGPVRVLDVQIAPGDTTLFHLHDTPFLAVRIAVSPVNAQILGAGWGGVGPRDHSHFYPGAIDSDTTYALQPLTHRVANVGSTAFRLIGITNAGAGIAPARSASSDLPGTLEHSSRWFQASRLAIPPGADSPWLTASTPVVVVEPGEGRVQLHRDPGTTTLLDAPAAWAYLPAGTRFQVSNRGTFSATLVFVAVR